MDNATGVAAVLELARLFAEGPRPERDPVLRLVSRLREVGAVPGGLVAVDASGNIALPFNCEGMYRAWIEQDGKVHTAIYRDDVRIASI